MKFAEIIDTEIDFVAAALAAWPMLTYNDRRNLTKNSEIRFPNLNKVITKMDIMDDVLTKETSNYRTYLNFLNEIGLSNEITSKLKVKYLKHFTDVSITMGSISEPANFLEVRRSFYAKAQQYLDAAITSCHDAYVESIMTSNDTLESKNLRIAALTSIFKMPRLAEAESFEELLTHKPSKGDVPEIVIPFPWNGVNELIDEKGMLSGRLTLIMALRGVGKTSIATQIAGNAALLGYKVMIFSMEMSKNQIRWRILAQVTRKSVPTLRRMKNEGTLPEEILMLGRKLDKNLIIERPLSNHVSAVKQSLDDYIRIHHESPVLVVYDYAQQATAGNINRADDLTQIATSFSNYAIDYNLHFICLSQLTEDEQKTKGAAGNIGHATFGKGLEDPASHVFILRDVNSNKKSLLLKKNRFGPKDIELEFYWYGESMMLYDDTTLPVDLKYATESAIDDNTQAIITPADTKTNKLTKNLETNQNDLFIPF